MTETSPLVSVIVPAYNAAAHIGEALGSVAAQTLTDWEVVVCDDGSSDDTSAIASSFHERVRVIRNPVNQGLASARNAAIRNSRGRLLALLDADDVWLPHYLERQVNQLHEHPRPETVGIVSCNAYLRDADGLLAGTYADRFGYAEYVGIEQLLDISPIFISALIPRAALEQVGSFATDLRSCEDLDLWLRLIEAGYDVLSTREPLAVYRLSPGQLSAQPIKMAQCRQAVYRRAVERGRLTSAQTRAAERAIRREQAMETIASLARDVRERRMPRTRLSQLGLLARVLGENPGRWRRWARLLKPTIVRRGRRSQMLPESQAAAPARTEYR